MTSLAATAKMEITQDWKTACLIIMWWAVHTTHTHTHRGRVQDTVTTAIYTALHDSIFFIFNSCTIYHTYVYHGEASVNFAFGYIFKTPLALLIVKVQSVCKSSFWTHNVIFVFPDDGSNFLFTFWHTVKNP